MFGYSLGMSVAEVEKRRINTGAARGCSAGAAVEENDGGEENDDQDRDGHVPAYPKRATRR
jgi:hypothetical protein